MKILELELVPSEGYEIMNEKNGNSILNSYLVNFWTHQNLFLIIQNGTILPPMPIFKGGCSSSKLEDFIERYLGSRLRLRPQNSSVDVIFCT